jgi:UDP-N-acetylmuramoyl-L-alanyl-D-glutamate--2,6-diaminopimelate ligase
MAEIAMALAGDPQRELLMIGITGTNGKSTTAHLLSLILGAAGRPAAFLGTLGSVLPNGETVASERTTLESTDLAPMLRRTLELGGRAVAMEVSSHALVQDRVAGIQFQVAVWTNLSRDHLDFHSDMEEYFQAKRSLFDRHLASDGRRVLPVDDEWAGRLLDDPLPGDVSWGLESGAVHALKLDPGLDGTTFELCLGEAVHSLTLPLIGLHNVRNALAAAAAAHAAGVSGEAICRGLSEARPLPGRLERVAEELEFPVLVDFAHTPDGLNTVVEGLRQISDRRLIVVFGAGGDKDRGKRGPMGFAVGSHADVAVVTSDNPRSEDPAVIAEAVADGVRAAGGEPMVVLDRRQAIARALEIAHSDSLVVVAGKGHEDVQTIGGVDIPFSDQQVIQELAQGVQ